MYPIVKSFYSKTNPPDRDIKIKYRKYGIMEKEYFDMYFTFENTNYLSKSRTLSIIESAENDVSILKNNIRSIKKRNLLLSLFDKLRNQFDYLTYKAFENLTTLFITDYHELFCDENDNVENKEFTGGFELIIILIKEKSFDEDYVIDILNKFKYNPFKLF